MGDPSLWAMGDQPPSTGGPGGGGVNVFSCIFQSQIAFWTFFKIPPLTPLTCTSGIHPWPLSPWTVGDWPPWTGGMGVEGVNDFSSICLLRLVSHTILNIPPLTPLPCMKGSIPFQYLSGLWGCDLLNIRVAGVGFYCGHILCGHVKMSTPDQLSGLVQIRNFQW